MRLSAILPLFLLVACSGGGATTTSNGSSGQGGSGPVAPTCLDGAGNPAVSCAVTPQADTCSMGDANACTPLAKIEVYADDGKNGVCLHLVYDNNCGKEAFADTCIEHQDTSGGTTDWQCWTSSVDVGGTIDVSQCHATGKYFYVSTTSDGQLDIDEQKCPAPTP